MIKSRYGDSRPAHGLKGHTTFRVTYRETDPMGHAYYGNYLEWFEIGRTEMLRSLGRAYRDWEQTHGVWLPVTSCWVDYKAPTRYDDLVTVETQVSMVTRASIAFYYTVRVEGSGNTAAVGETLHVFTTPDRKIARVADKLLPELFPVRR
ncbi:MAG: acyl-CoA thioesterase [Candidatus Sumerlaeaceae bacterium]|nr:acyl-CoA thioesterase [Candidatus Sumerlaeaceae bacterium]